MIAVDDARLGMRVRVTHVLARRVTRVVGGESKTWEARSLREPFDGIVVGVRTLFDGRTSWGYADEPTQWRQIGTVRALLVARNLRENPLRVPLDGATDLEELLP